MLGIQTTRLLPKRSHARIAAHALPIGPVLVLGQMEEWQLLPVELPGLS